MNNNKFVYQESNASTKQGLSWYKFLWNENDKPIYREYNVLYKRAIFYV